MSSAICFNLDQSKFCRLVMGETLHVIEDGDRDHTHEGIRCHKQIESDKAESTGYSLGHNRTTRIQG